MDAGDIIQTLCLIRAAVHPFWYACTFQGLVYMFFPGFPPGKDGIRGVPVLHLRILPSVGSGAGIAGCPHQVFQVGLRGCQPDFFPAFEVRVLFFPAIRLDLDKFLGGKGCGLSLAFAEIFFLCLWLPVPIFIQGPHGQKDVCMRVLENHVFFILRWLAVPVNRDMLLIGDRRIVDAEIGDHALRNKSILDKSLYQLEVFLRCQFIWKGNHDLFGESGPPVFFCLFYRVPQISPVLKLFRRMFRQHDFAVCHPFFLGVVLHDSGVLIFYFTCRTVGGCGHNTFSVIPFDYLHMELKDCHR